MQEVKEKLNLETASISWEELARFFAQGVVLNVDKTLDLIDVACSLSEDDASQLQAWLQAGKVAKVSDQQATAWHEQNAGLWGVVVRPWILVQDKA